MNKEEIKTQLKKEGYTLFNEYDDLPNKEFPDHSHEKAQKLAVIKGSMEVKMNGKSYILKSGDELIFPARMIHSAKMGLEGCEYIDAEQE